MTEDEVQQFLKNNVPRETFDKFSQYLDLIVQWQKYFNLVSRGTISHGNAIFTTVIN